jgi:hypothetical protein
VNVPRRNKRPPKPPPAIIKRIVQVFEPTEEEVQPTDKLRGYVTVEDYRAMSQQQAVVPSEKEGF